MKRAAGVDTIEEVVERFKTQDFTGKVIIPLLESNFIH